MVTLNHSFVSNVSDDPSVPQEVRPSNWNANHALTGGGAGQLVYDNGGAVGEATSPLVPAGGSGLAFTGPNILSTTGSDLVTDGNLATNPASSGWTLNDNTWSPGQISGTLVDITLGDVSVHIPITPVSNTWYVVEFHVTYTGGEGPAVYFDGAGGGGSDLTQLNSPIPPLTGAQVYKTPIYCAIGGANHLILDMQFYLYNGATQAITFVSMKAMATQPSPQIEITNYNGLTVFDSAGPEYTGYTALGNGALQSITSGACIGIGTNAGAALTTENRVTAIGNMAMALAVAPEFSVAIGDFALLTSQSGGFNTAIGSECLYSCLTGHHNQAIGPNSMFALTSGSYNHGLGEHTGLKLSTGSHNIMLGYGAGGSTLETGSFNILLGDQADVPSLNTSDYLNIGGAIIGNYSTGPLTVNVPWIQTAIQKSGVPTNTDIAAGQAAVFKDTSGGGVYLAYNDGGTIKKVALT